MSLKDSLGSVMSRDTRTKIHVDEIRVNKNNFYAHTELEEYYIVTMMEMIQKDGQDENGIVYFDDTPNDGKSYTLLSGERKYWANKRLYDLNAKYQNGDPVDGMFSCRIVDKPKTEEEELLRIIQGNSGRNKDLEIRLEEIKALRVVYNEKKEASPEKTMGRFCEFAATYMGVSPRTVENYEKKIKLANNEDGSNVATKEKEDVIPSAVKEDLKTISANMGYSIGRSVKVNDKFVISIKCENLDGLLSVMNTLGLDDQGFLK